MDNFPRFDLAGQVALVTGAARGLGRAISLALAHAGADIDFGAQLEPLGWIAEALRAHAREEPPGVGRALVVRGRDDRLRQGVA